MFSKSFIQIFSFFTQYYLFNIFDNPWFLYLLFVLSLISMMLIILYSINRIKTLLTGITLNQAIYFHFLMFFIHCVIPWPWYLYNCPCDYHTASLYSYRSIKVINKLTISKSQYILYVVYKYTTTFLWNWPIL